MWDRIWSVALGTAGVANRGAAEMSAETIIALMLAAALAALSLGVAALWLTGRVYTAALTVIVYLGTVIYALA